MAGKYTGWLLLAATLSCGVTQSAPVIREIAVEGNTEFSTREILSFLSSKAQTRLAAEVMAADRRTIIERYRLRGYLASYVEISAEVDADSSFADLFILIHEGKKSIVGNVFLAGVTAFPPGQLNSRFDTREGSFLLENMLEGDIAQLLETYERAGFPLTECNVARIETREGESVDTLNVFLSVREGERLTIDEIRVEGNKETNPAVIVRETRIAAGELYNPAKVDAIRGRLMRLGIFAAVEEPQLYVREDRSGLLIRVAEGNTNTFDGVIGYIPGSGTNQSGYVTGLISLSMRNLFGTGRKLAFKWAREDRSSQELSARYLEPWIFGLPANIGGGFMQRQQDSSYVRRVLDFRSELMLSEELSVAALFGSESVIPSASDSTFLRVYESSIVSVGAELLYDTRDDVYSPTSGARYRTDYLYGTKRVSRVPASLASRIPAKSTVQRFTLDFDFFLTTFERQVFAFGVHGRELQSGNPEEGEMFRLGGSRTLRGFRENQFIGSRVGWTNAEYRFLLARRSFLYGFVDAGYYARPADDVRGLPKAEAFKYGYGIGIQLETGLGVLGVSFAIGSENTSFSAGKIHFGLINEF